MLNSAMAGICRVGLGQRVGHHGQFLETERDCFAPSGAKRAGRNSQ